MGKNGLYLKSEENNICSFQHLVYHSAHKNNERPYTSLFFDTARPNELYGYALSHILFHDDTKYQDVLIADTVSFGRALMLGGSIQSTEYDEALYHEMLVHPAMLAHPNPEDILILGGRSGAALREVLKHPSVKSADMVEVDGELVKLAQQHLASWHQGSFFHPKVKIIIADPLQYVKKDKKQYDVIIVDLADAGDGRQLSLLASEGFYKKIQSRLKPKGIVAIQGMKISFLEKTHFRLVKKVKTVFSQVHNYHAFIPSLMGNWGFILASNWYNPQQDSKEEMAQRFEHALEGQTLHHITPESMQRAFHFCKKTKDLLKAEES